MVKGSPFEGNTLRAETDLLAGSGIVVYQWRRDGEAIPGATGDTYTVTAADAGHRISLYARRAGGTAVTSAPHGPALGAAGAAAVAAGLPSGLYITEKLGIATPAATGTLADLLSWLRENALPGFSYTLALAGGRSQAAPGSLPPAPWPPARA
jgi:hypothetical protein